MKPRPTESQILQSAINLQSNYTKVELVALARAYGWRGDHARAPMLQLALFVAMKTSKEETPPNLGDSPQDSNDQGASGNAPSSSQEKDNQEDQKRSSGGQDQDEGSQEEQEEQDEDGQDEDGQDEDGQDEDQEEDQEEDPDDFHAEFKALLKKAKMKEHHDLLEKVWRLTAKAGLNVMLTGPVGCGKTLLGEQLARLVGVPYGIINCTSGMSESQLSGRLLPGKGGEFGYVPSPFVTLSEQPSVFMLDELDAADPNVLMLINSMLANRFMSIPQRASAPIVIRDKASLYVAGINTLGMGADEKHSARNTLDGSTMDRFYMVSVDRPKAYVRNLFTLPETKRSKSRSAKWSGSEKIDQLVADTLCGWYETMQSINDARDFGYIIETRFAHKLISAAKVGIPIEEIKRDLTLGWAKDDKFSMGITE